MCEIQVARFAGWKPMLDCIQLYCPDLTVVRSHKPLTQDYASTESPLYGGLPDGPSHGASGDIITGLHRLDGVHSLGGGM